MARRAYPPISLLALLTIGGALPAGECLKLAPPFTLQAVRAQEPQRAGRIQEHMRLQKSAFGLGHDADLAVKNQFTDAYGETHVHFQQTHRGVKVFNSHLIGHMDVSGNLKPAHATVQANIQLEPATLLGSDRIEAIVRKQLPEGGRLWPMQIEQVVFPTKYQDGMKLVRGQNGGFAVDTRFSVATPRKRDEYRWAYRVSVIQANGKAMEGTEFVIDGLTGEVLKKWDGMMHQTAPVGSGKSQYNGIVPLGTELLTTGKYLLRDKTRATKEWPVLSKHKYWTECAGIGIHTMTYDDNSWNYSGFERIVNATNTWGDGLLFGGELYNTPGTRSSGYNPNAQTAAVDAHHAVQATWDYYQNVQGRSGGIDGQGGSPLSVVHVTDSGTPWANAAWNPSYFMMMYGDGGPTGSLTCFDAAAHEMSHGVMSNTADLEYANESGGLNEANSDVNAVAAKFWMWGAAGAGSTVPDAVTNSPDGNNDTLHAWTIGSQFFTSGEALRYLYKPSLDAISYDAWFDGIGLDDVHYSGGPGGRAFFFLAQGASSDLSSPTHSPYLPSGMRGIGNDQAAKIWYHAMATKVTDPTTNFAVLREAMISSAEELYGATAVSAVKNAFAAVNVGAADGAPEPPRVSLPSDPALEAILGDGRYLVAPTQVPITMPTPTVTRLADTSTTWSKGGLSVLYPEGGKFQDGTHFVAPVYTPGRYGTWPVKATSKADPKQFAVTMVIGFTMDCDADTETDACDLGAMALAYQLGDAVYPAANLYGSIFGADDYCIAFLLMGFNNAYKR